MRSSARAYIAKQMSFFALAKRLASSRQARSWAHHAGAIGLLGGALALGYASPSPQPSREAHLEDIKHRTYATRGNVREFRRYYREGEKLGEGTFAVVKRGVDLSTKEPVAIKAIDKSKSDEASLANEVNVMAKMGRHPNVVGLHNIYEDDGNLIVILDLAEGGELFERVVQSGELNEKEAARLFEGALRAVEHLHKKHIAHLDIKPENLLLKHVPPTDRQVEEKKKQPGQSKNQRNRKRNKIGEETEEIVVLADFGLALQDDNEQFDLCVGTPAYWAPEMVRRERFTTAVDMWALGCVLYILVCGIHPFDPTGDAPEAQILAHVTSGKYDTTNKAYQNLSEPVKDLIRHLLDPDPQRRYTATQALQHPWFQSAKSDKQLESVNKLSGFRILTLIKTGMRDMLRQAEEDLFDHLDANGDGYISKDELAQGLRVVGFDLPDAEIDAFLKLVDSDGDELISRKEFSDVLAKRFENDVLGHVRQDHASLEDLAALFKAYDKDGDGYIGVDDVHHVLSLLGSSATRSVVQNEWTNLVGEDQEEVSFAQFVRYIRVLESQKKTGNKETETPVSSVLTLRDKRDVLRSRRSE